MNIGTAAEAADLLAPLLSETTEERVCVLHLDPERRLLAMTVEEFGTAQEVELPIRAILQKAMRIGAHGIVIAHNHPSGNPTPSNADERATKALAEAARTLGLRLHDHLVFADGECRSFRALGLL